MNKVLSIIIITLSILTAKVEISIPGISAHFGNGASEAPRKIDENGIFVFNPGIGIGYDLRTNEKKSGFSFVANALYFKNCPDLNTVIAGAGVRGRYMASENVSIDLNLLPSIGWIDTMGMMLVPAVTSGINFKINERNTIGMTFAYVPGYDNGGDIGFFVLTFAF